MPCISKRILPVSRLVISTFRPSCEKVLLSSIFLIPEIDRIATGLESVTIPRRLLQRINLMSTVILPSSVSKDPFLICIKSYAERRNPANKSHCQHHLKRLLKPSSLQKRRPPHLNLYKGMINLIRLHQPSPIDRQRLSITLTHLQTIFSVPLTLLSLERRLNNRMVWYDDEMRILPLYYLSRTSLTVRSEQVMRIQLGATRVTAKSDGGLSFYPTLASAPNYPVFCIEVFYLPSFVINSNPRLGQAEEISFS